MLIMKRKRNQYLLIQNQKSKQIRTDRLRMIYKNKILTVTKNTKLQLQKYNKKQEKSRQIHF